MAPPKRTQPRNSWILALTWAQIDKRVALRQQGKLLQQTSRRIGRQIKAGLSGDWRQCAVTVVENIEKHLAGGETKEAWRCLKGWYRPASKQAPTASFMSLAAQTAEGVALYGGVPSPGEPLPIHGDKVDIRDGVPSNRELQEVVRGLRNGCATGTSGLQAEHIKV